MNPRFSLLRNYAKSPGVRAYAGLMLAFWLLGGGLWIFMGYEESFLWLNRQRFFLADLIAPHLTHLGDGILILGLAGLFLIPKRASWILAMLASLLGILLVILLCKNVLFEEWNRPLLVFSGKSEFFYNSLSTLKRHSFPSGHSAAIGGAMAVWVLALRPTRLWQGILMGALTLLVAMTRLYIGVHFLGDVVIGSLMGSLIALLIGLPLGDSLERMLPQVSEKLALRWQYAGAGLAVLSLFLGMALVTARYYA